MCGRAVVSVTLLRRPKWLHIQQEGSEGSYRGPEGLEGGWEGAGGFREGRGVVRGRLERRVPLDWHVGAFLI